MKRREFITLLGSAAAWPLAARAQQPAMPVIGFLTSRAPLADAHLLEAFRGGLREMDCVEGKNLAVEYRLAENHYERLPDLAADLVRRNVAAIFANGISVPPAMSATGAIPIVFTTGGDPVKLGFVVSLNSPGGNATGITTSNIANAVKRLDLLREMVPAAGTFAFLKNPDSPLTNLAEVQDAAAATGKRLVVISVREDRELALCFNCGSRLPWHHTLLMSMGRRLALTPPTVDESPLVADPERAGRRPAGPLIEVNPTRPQRLLHGSP